MSITNNFAVMSKTVPVIFACDEAYAPYLGVAIASMLDNADKSRFYDIHILYTDISDGMKGRLSRLEKENSRIVFDDMTAMVAGIRNMLHTRDYYSAATYYRIFSATLFPQYKKALYLDSDIAIKGDISRLFDTEIGGCLVGAACEESMVIEPELSAYSRYVLGVEPELYFNAGVLILNLAEFRRTRIEKRFKALLSEKKYTVAQDQDYLNVLCSGRVHYLGDEWNRTPRDLPGSAHTEPSLIHFKLNWKPWHFDGIMYGELFWKYARDGGFFDDAATALKKYSFADRMRDRNAYIKLLETADEQANEAITERVAFCDADANDIGGAEATDMTLGGAFGRV